MFWGFSTYRISFLIWGCGTIYQFSNLNSHHKCHIVHGLTVAIVVKSDFR